MKTPKLGILISGTGSNFNAILDNINNKSLQAEISCVISNKSTALGLKIAEDAGIPNMFVDPKTFDSHENYEEKILSFLKSLIQIG